MQIIPTPKTIKFNKESEHKGQFIIEPLYPGYGITIGNSLRRVLLSSIPGAAITSVKIKGVEHEFSSLDHVKEDLVDVLLNIKQINLAIHSDIDPEEPLVIKLKKTGEGKVTAADFECPSQVTVAGKNLVIATLTDKAADFEMECIVDKGMGYLPIESRSGEKLDIGHIAIDAIFTPINHVSISTEHVRVGEMTNWDKLVLSLETNGTISCQDAFGLAVDILSEQFGSLCQKEKKEPEAKEIKKPAIEEKPEEKEKKEEIKEVEEILEPIEEKKTEEKEEKTDEEKAGESPKRKRGRPKKEDK